MNKHMAALCRPCRRSTFVYKSCEATRKENIMVSSCCGKSSAGDPKIKVNESTSIMQDEIFPLEGNPYFTCIIWCSAASGVSVPTRLHRLLPPSSGPATICYLNKTWKMDYNCNRKVRRIEGGWTSFAAENGLKSGDGCVFELMDSKDLAFRVQILRGGIPDGYLDSRDGQSCANPVLIDD